MNRIGSPLLRKETPACSPGRYPDDQRRAEMACTCSVLVDLATSTTKVGRLWFSEPSPYETQEPRQGRPVSWLPVCIYVMAGSWLMASVCILRTKHMSSTILAVDGR